MICGVSLDKEQEKRTKAFAMRCYQRLLYISYRDHVTNEEVRRKIKAARVNNRQVSIVAQYISCIEGEADALPCHFHISVDKEKEKRTKAFAMRCYRRLLYISYRDHVTNEEVRRKIKAARAKYDVVLTLVKKRKLRWF